MQENVIPMAQLRALQGRRVSLALSDGGRIDDAQLIWAGRPGLRTVWVFSNGRRLPGGGRRRRLLGSRTPSPCLPQKAGAPTGPVSRSLTTGFPW
jgi:hypothetical protein